jgi:hypothetical protein
VPVTFRYDTRTWKLSIEKATKIDYNPDNINPNAKKRQALKKEFSEPFDERTVREKKAYAMKYNLHIEDQMFVVPISFIQKALRCYSMQSG